MKDQKDIVHTVYMDMMVRKDMTIIEEYRRNPDEVLARYGLNEKNRTTMKEILKL